jgi:2-polyprenyl-6-methoxyphenol hydroxylase-like FAD-dependent oxidoreductase
VTLPYQFVVQNVSIIVLPLSYLGIHLRQVFEKYNWDRGDYIIDPDHWGLIARRGKGGLWRVTYGGDLVPGLTDEEYLERRLAHLKAMLPGHPNPGDYLLVQTNLYNIHNRCASQFKVGRIILARDAAYFNNPTGGYGCITAALDVGGLADCFIGYAQGLAGLQDVLLTVYLWKLRWILCGK